MAACLTAAFLSFQGTDGCIFQETGREERAGGGGVGMGVGGSGMFSMKTNRFTPTEHILQKASDDGTIIVRLSHKLH